MALERRPRGRLDQPREVRRGLVPTPAYDADAFGRLSERIARFIGTGRFLVYMTVFVVVWVAWNAVEWKLQYDDYPFILLPNATVAEALAHVRKPDLSPALASQVYVCRPPTETPTGRFLGLVHIQRLLREPPSTLVGGVVDSGIEPLHVDVQLPAITHHLATYNLVAAPVVDENDHLLGAVTVDDVLDHLLPEDWREQDRSAMHISGGTDGS